MILQVQFLVFGWGTQKWKATGLSGCLSGMIQAGALFFIAHVTNGWQESPVDFFCDTTRDPRFFHPWIYKWLAIKWMDLESLPWKHIEKWLEITISIHFERVGNGVPGIGFGTGGATTKYQISSRLRICRKKIRPHDRNIWKYGLSS